MEQNNLGNETVETTTPAAPAVEQTQVETVITTEEVTPEVPATGTETTENTGIDYAAEYEKVSKQLGQAEHVIETLKKKPVVETDPDDEPPVPATQPDVATLVREQVSAAMGTVTADTVDSILESMTDNEDERKLIFLLYDKKIQKSGFSRADIRTDLNLAHAMANSGKIAKENSELRRTVATKKTIVNTASGQNQDRYEPVTTQNTSQFSEEDLKVMAHYGIKPEDVKTGGVVS